MREQSTFWIGINEFGGIMKFCQEYLKLLMIFADILVES